MKEIDLRRRVDSKLSFSSFPGGERHVKLNDNFNVKGYPVRIVCSLRTSDQIIELLLLTDALRRAGAIELHLRIMYLGYMRQDRVCNPGEALSIKVITDLINAQDYTSLEILEPHSDVTSALLTRCKVIGATELVANAITILSRDEKIDRADLHTEELALSSPDAGAVKRVYTISRRVGLLQHVVECSKKRNVVTGALSGFTAPDVDPNVKYIIVCDDICDGGGTFLGLADALKQKTDAKLYLCVTHGLFTQGIDKLLTKYERIITSDSLPQVQHDRLKVIEL